MAVILRAAAVLSGASIPTGGFSQTWWLPQTVGGSNADATDILARFRAAWATWAPNIGVGYTATFDPICIAVESTTGVLVASFAGTQPAAVTGSGAGDPLPFQTQGLVRLLTSTVLNGRRVQGRLFIPGPLEGGNTTGGGPTAAYQTAYDAGGDGMLAAGATTSSLQVWHRPVNGAGGANASVTSTSPSPTWAVLRSRRS